MSAGGRAVMPRVESDLPAVGRIKPERVSNSVVLAVAVGSEQSHILALST